jgi:cytochrome c5
MKLNIGYIILLAMVGVVAAEPSKDALELYSKACSTCHAPEKASALGAPAAFSQTDWAPRMENAAQHSGSSTEFKDAYAYLLDSVKRGRGLMAHGGLCKDNKALQALCTDDNYIATIKYMSTPSK